MGATQPVMPWPDSGYTTRLDLSLARWRDPEPLYEHSHPLSRMWKNTHPEFQEGERPFCRYENQPKDLYLL